MGPPGRPKGEFRSAEHEGSQVSPEGSLQVSLRVAAGVVARCEITSTRPDVAGRLLQGRSPEDIAALVPRLFTLCSASQSAACTLALGAALGRRADREHLAEWHHAVADEARRETALRLLLQWPQAIGEAPSADALAAARAARDGHADDRLAAAVFGRPAADWLALTSTPAAWWDWAAGGGSAAARWVATHRTALETPTPGVALLPAHPDPAWWSELAQHAMGDRGFERQPHWRGAVAETGALARRAQDPLVAALLAGNARPAARVAARLRELAAALVAPPDPGDPLVGGLSLGDGVGLGWAENARGRLLHLVQIQAGRATLYRIVAPTEWNFHPRGGLAAALLGATATDAAALQQRARVLVDGLDPCVACTVEVGDA